LQGAPPRAAVVAALAAGALSPYIYEVFRKEWEARGMEPIIIEELARMLEDQGAERGRREGEEIGRREGEEIGRREGEEMVRRVILDLADAYGLALDEPRRAWIASASLEELERVRVTLKRERAWPTLSGATMRRPLVPVAAADLRVHRCQEPVEHEATRDDDRHFHWPAPRM